MITVGIDPGKQGSIVFVDTSTMALVGQEKMPLGLMNEWNPELMGRMVHGWYAKGVRQVVIERVHAFPGPQAYASSVTMFGYGMWLGCLHANGFAPTTVSSEVWKKDMDILVPIIKKGKKATPKEKQVAYKARKLKAVELAEVLFPDAVFRTKKGALMDGLAEAALLAYWLERGCARVPVAKAAAV